MTSAQLKDQAYRMGFAYCGVAQARRLVEEEPRLEAWLKAGHHGQMGWMERNYDKRLDPRELEPGTKSVVSLLYNYYPPQWQRPDAGAKISCYAYGTDYHTVLRQKVNDLLAWLRAQVGEVGGRGFVDSAPVMDKAWARLAGAGWVGKHTNLIRPRAGSYFFIAELLLDLDLEPDGPVPDLCGTCTRCIDACPTDAIYAPYKLDATRCISYLTIELKDAIPTEFAGKMEGWAFGCDICQQVCPWNRFATPHEEPAFALTPAIAELSAQEWAALDEAAYKRLLAHTPLARTKWRGWQRNLAFLNEEYRIENIE